MIDRDKYFGSVTVKNTGIPAILFVSTLTIIVGDGSKAVIRLLFIGPFSIGLGFSTK